MLQVIITGPPGGADVDLYTGFTGPTSFGSGGLFFADTGSGDIVGIDRRQGFFSCHRAMFPVLLYRTA